MNVDVHTHAVQYAAQMIIRGMDGWKIKINLMSILTITIDEAKEVYDEALEQVGGYLEIHRS